jgi:SulP family sulfate permease
MPYSPDEEEPHNTLVKTLSSYGQLDGNQFRRLSPYFVRLPVPEGLVLFRQDDPSDGLYVVESGILRAVYQFSEHTPSIEESMVPGTLAGELMGLSSMPRNATVTVERAAVLWKLSIGSLKKLEGDDPILTSAFTRVLLKGAS